MCEVLYTENEGECFRLAKIDGMSEEVLKKLCEAQKKDYVDPYHRARLTCGYIAAAVLFHDGLIWDAILSGYRSTSRKHQTLPKSFPLSFRRQ